MVSKIKKQLSRNLLNLPGWRTNHKIVVIESVDWFGIGMSSKESFNALKKAGLSLDKGAGE
jgi:hypothetical protein